MDEEAELLKILFDNKDKNFVRRIIEPENYPTLDLGNGSYATHLMSYVTDSDGNAYVYPNVIYDKDANKLINLGDKAWDYAKKNGEFIRFNDRKKADWFSKKYKSVWGD